MAAFNVDGTRLVPSLVRFALLDASFDDDAVIDAVRAFNNGRAVPSIDSLVRADIHRREWSLPPLLPDLKRIVDDTLAFLSAQRGADARTAADQETVHPWLRIYAPGVYDVEAAQSAASFEVRTRRQHKPARRGRPAGAAQPTAPVALFLAAQRASARCNVTGFIEAVWAATDVSVLRRHDFPLEAPLAHDLARSVSKWRAACRQRHLHPVLLPDLEGGTPLRSRPEVWLGRSGGTTAITALLVDWLRSDRAVPFLRAVAGRCHDQWMLTLTGGGLDHFRTAVREPFVRAEANGPQGPQPQHGRFGGWEWSRNGRLRRYHLGSASYRPVLWLGSRPDDADTARTERRDRPVRRPGDE